MAKFNIVDIYGNILMEVDTVKYPKAKRHNCRIKDPVNNIITHVNDLFFIAKRNRKGIILDPLVWCPITQEYYDMFFKNGAAVIPAPESLIESVKEYYRQVEVSKCLREL